MSFSSRVSRLRPSCSGNRHGQSPLGMTGIGPMSPPPAWCLCDIIQSEDREALPGSSTGRGSFMNIRGISDVYGVSELEAAGSALIKAHERRHDLDEWGPSFAGVGHHRRRSAMYSSLTWRQAARAAAGVRDSHSALACTSLS